MKLPERPLHRFQWRLLLDYLAYLNTTRKQTLPKEARVKGWTKRGELKLEK